ncbi:MAG: translation elongation factor Ts [candidate division KSB1 bacterium]|nr:translation elongation factor Ts [candidate division KSB1 bacterium]MDZ7370742.1 translation elongation factor Ts [candidate division KSB1 bacterium]
MAVTAADVQKLREMTGAGMMDCKKALTESGGDFDKAVDYLRTKGLQTVDKKAGRATDQGIIQAYIHPGSRLGVLVEINCETDFVARTPDFQNFAKDVAMQIAASKPIAVRREDVPQHIVEHELEIYRAQAREQGKPENVIERMIGGKLEKFYQENCLLEQAFVKNPDMTIRDYLNQTISKLGENIVIKRFVRYQLGE